MRITAIVSLAGAFVALASACGSFSASDKGDVDGGADAAPADGASTTSDGSVSNDGGVPDGASTGDASPGTLKVFITGVGYADVTNALSADAKCAAEATGRLPGKFVAWYPDANVAAPARLVRSNGQPVDGPWFRVDGALVAATRAALTNTATVPLAHGIDLTAAGTKNGTGGVWTGTLPDGGVGITCSTPSPTTGTAGQTGPAWTTQMFFTATCGSSLGLYCFQVE